MTNKKVEDELEVIEETDEVEVKKLNEEVKRLSREATELKVALENKEIEFVSVESERDGLHDELNAYRISGMTREEQLEAEKSELESELRKKEVELSSKAKEVETLKSDVEKERLNLIKEKILREYPEVLPEWIVASDELSMRNQAKKASEHLAKLAGAKQVVNAKTKENDAKVAEDLRKAEELIAAENVRLLALEMAGTSSPGNAQEQVPAEQKDLEIRYQKARDDEDVTLATKLRLELSKFKGRQILETN